jgi:hypothetical protein
MIVPQAETEDVVCAFTETEQAALRRLRLRYQESRDLFNDRELARLRFLRWLHGTGHSAPGRGDLCSGNA